MEEKKIKTENKVEQKLNPLVWDVKYNADLLAQVLYIYNSNERKSTANVKSRGDVSGGGKKPWKQKGTGRARHGSSRSPIWVGGGVAFANIGDKNFEKKMNKKMARKATCMMLSERLRNEQLEFVQISSEEFSKMREKLVKDSKKSSLVISNKEDVVKSLRNVEKINVVSSNKLNAKHLISSKRILVDNEIVNILETRLTNGK